MTDSIYKRNLLQLHVVRTRLWPLGARGERVSSLIEFFSPTNSQRWNQSYKQNSSCLRSVTPALARARASLVQLLTSALSESSVRLHRSVKFFIHIIFSENSVEKGAHRNVARKNCCITLITEQQKNKWKIRFFSICKWKIGKIAIVFLINAGLIESGSGKKLENRRQK